MPQRPNRLLKAPLFLDDKKAIEIIVAKTVGQMGRNDLVTENTAL